MLYPIGTRLKENEYFDEFDHVIVGYAILGTNELHYIVDYDHAEYDNIHDFYTQADLDKKFELKRLENAQAD